MRTRIHQRQYHFSAMMNCTDRKYFRFHTFIFLCLAFCVSFVNCSNNKQSSCLKVAAKVKSFLMGEDVSKVDPEFLADFAFCIRDMYKLYKDTNWTTIEKIIPGMETFIKEIAPQIAKKVLRWAGKAGLQFTSAYLFYKNIELHGRAIELESDMEFYRKQFEYLQTKNRRPLLEQVKRDVLPILDKLDSATSSELTKSTIIEDLGNLIKELKEMLRKVYKDLKDARINKAWSVGYGVGAASLCAAPFLLGQPYLAVVTCGLGIPGAGFNAHSFYSFRDTEQKLEVLIKDVEALCKETEDYLILLKGKYPSY